MEIIAGIIVALLGGLFFFKKKADKAAVDSKLAETRGRDQELEISENELEAAIAEIDENLTKIKEERDKRRNEDRNMTLAERRARIKKGLN